MRSYRNVFQLNKDKGDLKQNDSKKEPSTPEKNQDEIAKLRRILHISQSTSYFFMGGYTIWASSRMETLTPQVLLIIVGSVFLLISISLCLIALSPFSEKKCQKLLVYVDKHSPPTLSFVVFYISFVAIILTLGSSQVLFWPVAIIGLAIGAAVLVESLKKK